MRGAEAEDLTARLANVARLTPHAIVLCDASGRIDWVNDGFTAMTGFDLAEAAGRTPGALLQCPETDPATIAMMSACVAAGEGFRVEVFNCAKDGRRFWLDLDVRPTFSARGELDGFMAIQADITAARNDRNRLNSTSVALKAVGRLARLGAWEVDVVQQVVRWSPELADLLGRPYVVEGALDTLNVYAPEVQEAVQAHIGQAIKTGERIDFEAPAITGSGERIWLRVMGEPRMVDGRCVALHGASQDVTAQREAVAELRESERFGRGVIDGLAALLTVIDETGAIIAANSAFRKLGAEVAQADVYPMGRNLFEVFDRLPGGRGKSLTRGVKRVLAGGADTFAYAYQSRSGEWFRLTAARFQGAGPVRCVVITQSIDDLKRSEKRLKALNVSLKRARDDANAANAAKSAFLATMSHEIRTPLNGVLGMAQAMARDELSDRQRERLTVVRQAGETLLALLNDLLDLSRIEAGRLELEDGLIDIESLMTGVQATFTTLASDKDVSFHLAVSPKALGLWRGDPTRVRQVVYNLVSNAVKFTARGEVRVAVRREGGALVFEVADTGPGIAEDRLGSLFHKFVQEDASTTRRYGGSGLGLAICRELATLMGGEVGVVSSVGEGSTFTVRLPLSRAEGALPASVSMEITAPSGDLRILAAEDNPMNQLVLKTLMAQLGVEVRCVNDGQAACDAAAEQEWDVILMDVQMPVMDGPTAARWIREREEAEGLRRTPIIALTANAMAHHAAEYTSAGMDVLVPKPLELERLIGAIQAVMEEAA
ncbi:ATP-binding protein [Phenylobacterium sp.]|uniref:PAS domain-containing hybrid sensor histidine kinase/response regulator n=1 Tax=Phenylobacterium sp. TaxID=1871053 RepID=UPI00272FF1FD|nr:ATP-binding protein [Phenylobacterium sp.]MDP1598635.1 ATP-binding protein [Phenylobacterium sp.]